MKGDYYAILGVSPASEDVVIRAAYRALMRRYHPDADPSSDATERARSINAAYAVLSDPAKRARYDAMLAARGMIKLEPQPHPGGARAVPRPGPAALAALALLAVLLALIALSPPIAEFPGAPAVIGGADGAAPAGAEQFRPAAAAANRASEACTGDGAQGLIKSELFARAGRIRGGDVGFAAVADRALVRLSVAEAVPQPGRGVSCSGWVALDLPPGVVVEHGRSNLNAELNFNLVPAGYGEFRLAGLSGAEELVATLSSLGRAPGEELLDQPIPYFAAAPAPSAFPGPAPMPVRVHRSTPMPGVPERMPARASPAPARNGGSPCDGLSGRAERAICSSRNLAALDRQLVLMTGQSLKAADAGKRAALLGSNARFREQRDSCRSESCMTSAYLARMREVSNIMATGDQP